VQRPADQPTLTRRYTDEAVKFIREHREKPFFLYLAHTMPHVPLFASKDFQGKSRRGLFGDVVEELDHHVGRVLQTLRDEKLAERTLVFFTSDNGPWLIMDQHGGSAGLLREGKGSTWEGGMRVPGIAWWPGRIKAGRVTTDLACTMDLFTTAVRLAGGKVPDDRPVDGLDLTPLLEDKGPSPRQTMYFYRDTELYAVRKGPFKAHLVTRPAYGPEQPVRHERPLLFHLEHDPSERFNVAARHPEVVEDLLKEVKAHSAGMKPGTNQLQKKLERP
jgi:arylsulfatase A